MEVLRVSCIEGNLDPIRRFLATHEEGNTVLNEPDEEGNTALHLAAMHGHKGAVLMMIAEYGANPNVINAQEMTPATLAKQRGFNDIAALILAYQSQPFPNVPGSTPSNFSLDSPSVPGTSPTPPPGSSLLSSSSVLQGDPDRTPRPSTMTVIASNTDSPKSTTSSTLISSPPPLSPGSDKNFPPARQGLLEPRRNRSQSLPEPFSAVGAKGPPLDSNELLVAALARLNFFTSAPQHVWKRCLSLFMPRNVPAGLAIAEQNTSCDYYYVIESGKFEASLRDENGSTCWLPTLERGDSFGEVSVLFNAPIPFSVKCLEAGKLWLFPRTSMEYFISSVPVSLEMSSSRETLDSRSSEPTRPATPTLSPTTPSSSSSPSSSKHKTLSKIFNFGGKKKSKGSISLTPHQTHELGRQLSDSDTSSVDKEKPDSKHRLRVSSVAKGLKKLLHISRAGAIAEEPSPTSSTFDFVLRPLNPTSKLPVAYAGTLDRLVEHLFLCPSEDLPTYVASFLRTYRLFADPMVLVKSLEQASHVAHASLSPALADNRLAAIIHCWIRPSHVVDAKVFTDASLIEAIRHLVKTQMVANVELRNRLIHETGLVPNMPVPKHFSRMGPTYTIVVNITKPGDLKSSMKFSVTLEMQLKHLLDKVCADSRSKRSAAMGKNYDHLIIERDGYQFRAPGFATVIPLDSNIMELRLMEVNLYPIRSYRVGQCMADYIQPVYIAHQLTYLDFWTFALVEPSELMQQAWSRAKEGHVHALTHRFNQFVDWGVALILNEKNSWERARIIMKVLEIGGEFYDLNNFHGVTQVLSILRNASVKRLKLSWTLVDNDSMSLFNCLDKMINPKRNRVYYRHKLASIPKNVVKDEYDFTTVDCAIPALPYFGQFLSDMVFCEDGNKSSLPSFKARGLDKASKPDDETQLINFYKFRSMARLLEEIETFQSCPYNPDKFLEAAMKNINFAVWYFDKIQGLAEEEAYQKSLTLEPRGKLEPAQLKVNDHVTVGKSFVVRTVDDYAMTSGGAITTSDNGSNSSGTLLDTSRFQHNALCASYQLSFLVESSFLTKSSVKTDDEKGEVSAPTFDETLVKKHLNAQKKKKAKAQSVYFEFKDDRMTVYDSQKSEVVIKRNFGEIDYYKVDSNNGIFFFIASDFSSFYCYVFTSDKLECEEIFVNIHRRMKKWQKSSENASNAARNAAVAKLKDAKFPAPNGAFVLRPSSSRPGCYALSLKHDDDSITHFLIEPSSEGGLKLKDADKSFLTLCDLLAFYMKEQGGLPCLLNPDGANIMTDIGGTLFANKGGGSSLDDGNASSFDRNSHTPGGHPVSLSSEPPADPNDPSSSSLQQVPAWDFGLLSRVDAESVLLAQGPIEGMFLLRKSSSGEGNYALSFVCDAQIIHLLLERQKDGYYLNAEYCADSLEKIIELFQDPSHNYLPILLSSPCPKKEAKTVLESTPSKLDLFASMAKTPADMYLNHPMSAKPPSTISDATMMPLTTSENGRSQDTLNSSMHSHVSSSSSQRGAPTPYRTSFDLSPSPVNEPSPSQSQNNIPSSSSSHASPLTHQQAPPESTLDQPNLRNNGHSSASNPGSRPTTPTTPSKRNSPAADLSTSLISNNVTNNTNLANSNSSIHSNNSSGDHDLEKRGKSSSPVTTPSHEHRPLPPVPVLTLSNDQDGFEVEL